MDEFNTLKQEIMVKMDLDESDRAPSDFYTCYCPICKKKNKKTGGFYFDEEDLIVYNCFRASCDASVVYERGSYIPKKFRHLMEEIGVEIPIELFKASKEAIKEKKETQGSVFNLREAYKDISQEPEFLDYYNDCVSVFNETRLGKKARELLAKRKVDVTHWNDFLLNENNGELALLMRWYGKIIGIQRINLFKKGYKTKGFGNKSLVYAVGGEIPTEPVVVEGVFDALTVPNGVAIMSNSISKHMLSILQTKSPILIPDKGNSKEFVKLCRNNGWRICVPSWLEKDPNDAAQRYGKLTVVKMIKEGVHEDVDSASLKLKIWEEG